MTPNIYFIEPYNAYAPKHRKKHFHEILEEQALMERIIMEAEANRISQENITTNVSNGHATAVATAAGIDHPSVVTANFDVARTNSGSSAPASTISGSTTGSLVTPLKVSFRNLTTDSAPKYPVTYKWSFGDGTTSSLATPPIKSYSTGSYTVKLEATSSYGLTNSSAVTRLAISCSL